MDLTKDYGKYRTLFALPEECIVEYERLMQPDPMDGIDVYEVINISEKEALLGIQKELDVTIAGMTKRILVKVPAGIKSEQYIRYREKGEAGQFGGKNGDLYVKIVVKKEETVPSSENSDEQNIFKNAKQTGPTKENTIPIHITFLEAAKGTEKEINLPEKKICKNCKGTGKINVASCRTCNGSGKIETEKIIRVKVPAGIDEGQLLHVKLKKEFDFDDLFGYFFEDADDWYAKVHIGKHPKFERKGYDIYSTEYLPFYIGSSRNVAVDTLDGKQYCKITKETKDGSQTCLTNMGIQNLKNPSIRGNHYVTWKKK